MADITTMTVAILGGTGGQGQGLAFRFAQAGLSVVIGSRDAERAATSANELAMSITAGSVEGLANADAAARADIVIVAVPWEAHEQTLRSLTGALAGKIVVDCVNPIAFDEFGPAAITVAEGSAAEQARNLLPESRVVAAFQNVSAVVLSNADIDDLDQDVLVLGDDREATDLVSELAGLLPGVRGIYGGRLRLAGPIEALTANLIAINRRYKTHAGIKVSGVANAG